MRETLSACSGYESKEVAGLFMVAFGSAAAALEWALALQLALLHVPWPQLLLECQAAGAVQGGAGEAAGQQAKVSAGPGTTRHFWSHELEQPLGSVPHQPAGLSDAARLQGQAQAAQLLFCGLRAKVGVYSGRMDRVLPHGKSGRADYLGPPANRAARLMAAAQGGQVSGAAL